MVLGAACVLFLSACASASRVALAPETRAQLGQVKTLACFDQQEMNASITPSNIAQFTGGGLIPALIDAGINSSRAKRAEAAVAPIRDALIGFDVSAEFNAALTQALGAGAGPLSLRDFEVFFSTDFKALRERIDGGAERPQLVIHSSYLMRDDFTWPANHVAEEQLLQQMRVALLQLEQARKRRG